MADISQYLSEIEKAVYGEDVRSSIYNAIDLINKVGEAVLDLGTAVTASNSSVVGYYEDSVYINTNTWDVWKCNGPRWIKQGNLLGSSIERISKSGVKDGTNGLVDIYKVYTTNNVLIGSFNVTNSSDIELNKTGNELEINLKKADGTTLNTYIYDGCKLITGTTTIIPTSSSIIDYIAFYQNDYYLNTNTWDLWCYTGSLWQKKGNIKGAKGDKGDQGYSFSGLELVSTSGLNKTYNVKSSDGSTTGTIVITDGSKGDKGDKGDQGVSPTITESKSGIVTTITVKDANGTHTFEIKDGQSGDGTGDMLKSVYDTDKDGVIDLTALPIATDDDIRNAIDNSRKES